MSLPHWTFIGAGNMASSLIGGLIASGVAGENITVFDVSEEATKNVAARFNVNAKNNIEQLEPGASVVIAVKPNIVQAVCESLASKQPALVISVAAGVQSSSMSTWLGNNTPIVRCMPNTPALLAVGATVLCANDLCTDQHREQSEALLSTAGMTRWVDKESDLDAVTALSGSGPAYFFYLIEHMIESAVNLGLSEDMARDLAIETAFGAASMARKREHTPATLRENVTSKGGTTHAAITVFNEVDVPAIIAKAMKAAQQRAAELGDEFGAS